MFGFKRNVNFLSPLNLSSWRKAAIGTWKTVGDPSVYGVLELDAGPALRWIEKLRQEQGVRVTLSHLVGRACALMLKDNPDINGVLRWGRIYPRQDVDIFFQVATDTDGKDLTGAVIRKADQKGLIEIAKDLESKVRRIRHEGDKDFARMKKTTGAFPGILARIVVGAGGVLLYLFNLWTPLLGMPRDPFGSMMVTNVGSIGLDLAFAPLVPYSRVPLLIVVGQVQQKAIVEHGQIRIAEMLTLCATFDHRLIDGMHASKMTRRLKELFANPALMD